jgi:hypothetical protein
VALSDSYRVIAGLDPAIHQRETDPRVKPAGDGEEWIDFIQTLSAGI